MTRRLQPPGPGVGGVLDAPQDGQSYVRRNGQWVLESVGEILSDGSVSLAPSGNSITLGVVYAPAVALASNAVPLQTDAAPPGTEYLRLDNGSGGDFTIPVGGRYELLGSFFASVSASSAEVWLQAQYTLNSGGAWVDLGNAVIDRIGTATGAVSETASGELPPFLLGVPVQFRWLAALNAGPAGSTVTYNQGIAYVVRLA